MPSRQPARRRRYFFRCYFFFFGVAFFAADFLAAFFFAGVLALAFTSSPSAWAFFALGCFLGSSGAVNFCPSKAISVMRTAVNGWRCPRSFLYCFFFL